METDILRALKMANSKKNVAKQITDYRYNDKRKNDPYVGVVDTKSGGVEGQTTWTCDPHLDPTLNFNAVSADIENLKDIKVEPNESLLARFQGAKPLPFEPGNNRHTTGKIVDNPSIKSSKALDITDRTTETEP